MIEESLSTYLLNNGYTRLNSNAQGIYLFYLVQELELSIISIVHVVQGNELTLEQYEHIQEQIKESFQKSYSQSIKLLSLILTDIPEKAKQLATLAKQDSHWIIDLQMNRLIIYENQDQGYNGLRLFIDQLMAEGQEFRYGSPSHYDNSFDESNYNQGGKPYTRSNNRFAIMPITSVIIALNLVAYFITHYTGFLGGEYGMLEKGALSWFYIKQDQEFYRLLTSMFMHSDWNHLMNNMIVLLFIGGKLEGLAGRYKYLFVYLGSGFLAGITSISYNMWKEYGNVAFFDTTISIGASGAIFGIVGAMFYIVILNRGRIAEISTSQMILFVALSLYSGIANAEIDQAAHVGGFVVGFMLAVILYRKPENNREI